MVPTLGGSGVPQAGTSGLRTSRLSPEHLQHLPYRGWMVLQTINCLFFFSIQTRKTARARTCMRPLQARRQYDNDPRSIRIAAQKDSIAQSSPALLRHSRPPTARPLLTTNNLPKLIPARQFPTHDSGLSRLLHRGGIFSQPTG